VSGVGLHGFYWWWQGGGVSAFEEYKIEKTISGCPPPAVLALATTVMRALGALFFTYTVHGALVSCAACYVWLRVPGVSRVRASVTFLSMHVASSEGQSDTASPPELGHGLSPACTQFSPTSIPHYMYRHV
jgi:hypothetical protein